MRVRAAVAGRKDAPEPTIKTTAPALLAVRRATLEEDDCPVIYADRVYLGLTGPRRLRVVCFESNDQRRSLVLAG